MSELAAFFEVEKRIYQAESRTMSARLVAHYARVRHELSQDIELNQDISADMVTGFGPTSPQKPIVLLSWPSYYASPDAPTVPDINKTLPLRELHAQGRYNDAL